MDRFTALVPVCGHWPWLGSGTALTCCVPGSSVQTCRHAASVAPESSEYSSLPRAGNTEGNTRPQSKTLVGDLVSKNTWIYFNIMLSENWAKFLTSLVKIFACAWYPTLMFYEEEVHTVRPRPTSALLTWSGGCQSAASPRATPVPCSCSRTGRSWTRRY